MSNDEDKRTTMDYVISAILGLVVGAAVVWPFAIFADDLCDYDAYNLHKYQYVPIDGSTPALKNFENPTSDMYFFMSGRGFTLQDDYKVKFPMPYCEWFDDQKLRNDEFQQPVIIYKPGVYLINHIQQYYWLALSTGNMGKYSAKELRFSGKHRRSQADLYVKHMKDIGTIPKNAIYDMVLTVKSESKAGWVKLLKLSDIMTNMSDYVDISTTEPSVWLYRMFLTPHMLAYVQSDGPVYDPVVEEKKRIKSILLPAIMERWRDSGSKEGTLFLEAAYRVMDGVDPFEYVRMHGYIPADRSIKDMQYNYALRSSNKVILARNHKVEPAGYDYIDKPPRIPSKPLTGYTYETKSMYYEERKNTIADNISANQLVDSYLGITNDYPDVNQTIMDNLLADYGMLDDNPYKGVE